MAVSLKHKFLSAKADSGDASLVRPSNWNDEHTLVMSGQRLLGKPTAGDGPVVEVQLDGTLGFNAGKLGVANPYVGDFSISGTFIATGNVYGGILVSQGTDGRAAIMRGDGQKYIQWLSADASTQRGYVGYGGAGNTFVIYNSGDINLSANNGNESMVLGSGKATFNKSIDVTATLGNHGVVGRANNGASGSGGVIGFASGGVYGVLGHDGANSFYGIGTMRNNGAFYITGNIFVTGNIVDSAGTLALGVGTGQVYGTTWGGYLSSYLDNRYVNVAAPYSSIGSVQSLKITYTAVNIAPGGTASGSLLSNSDGTTMSGVWMNVDYNHATNGTIVLWRRIG